MKLKTLKDMNLICEDVCPKKCTNIEYVRQEAIKWIKDLDKELKEIHKSPELYSKLTVEKIRLGHEPEHLVRAQNQILWIKHFFNITNEDLK